MKMKKMVDKRAAHAQSGFTLIEVMMSVLVFVFAILSFWKVSLGVFQLNESSRNLISAMADGQTVLEAIRQTSSSGIGMVKTVNWTDWGQANGLTSLQKESIVVTYTDPTVDPLPVNVQINWQERGRAKSVLLNTLVTQR